MQGHGLCSTLKDSSLRQRQLSISPRPHSWLTGTPRPHYAAYQKKRASSQTFWYRPLSPTPAKSMLRTGLRYSCLYASDQSLTAKARGKQAHTRPKNKLSRRQLCPVPPVLTPISKDQAQNCLPVPFTPGRACTEMHAELMVLTRPLCSLLA